MRLLLIAPATRENTTNRRRTLFPPLGLATIAALTPPEIEVSLVDENVAVIDFSQDIDLVGITAQTITAYRAYQIADIFKARGAKVVLGGSHPSALPEEAMRHADAVVVGEAEGIWPKLLDDFKSNRLQGIYRQDERPSLVNLPIPRRDLFAEGAYDMRNTISTTRGCPNACSFCSIASFFGRTYRCRPIAEILKEMETLNCRKPVVLVDDNIVGNPKFAKELFRALIPYKLKWAGQASITVAKDDELLSLAAESGCADLLIGFETLSPANLIEIGKHVNRVSEYEASIRKIHAQGIAIHGCFILGLDEDDAGVFERTIRFAEKMKLESAGFAWPVPYPGTALCDSLDKAGRVVTKDWSQYESTPVFKPKRLSQEALKAGCNRISCKFFSLPSILKRLGLAHRYPLVFWVANLAFRASWRKKSRYGSFETRLMGF